MARNVSAITRSALNAPSTDKVFLLMVEITSPQLAQPLYFVQNNENITSNGNEYIAVNFTATPPTQEDGGIQDTTISISGINRQITETIRSITDAPDMSMFIIRSDAPDVVEVGPWNFKLRQVTYDKTTVSGSLQYDTSLRRNISTITVNSLNFPGVFD